MKKKEYNNPGYVRSSANPIKPGGIANANRFSPGLSSWKNKPGVIGLIRLAVQIYWMAENMLKAVKRYLSKRALIAGLNVQKVDFGVQQPDILSLIFESVLMF